LTEFHPGPDAARERAERVPDRPPVPVSPPGGGRILVGTAGWTDRTLTKGGVFYPSGVSSAEDRLRYYASRFPMVEIDAPYYSLPTRQMGELWLDRTPPEFTFDVKAHALMTGQPTEVKRLPKELREALPAELAAKHRVYAKDLPRELEDAVWAQFIDALQPLHSAGKLGSILLQYPRWFLPGGENRERILEARERLGDMDFAVELRNRRWFAPKTLDRTLRFFEEHQIPFVMVDGPQGLESSVPPLTTVPSPKLAIVRFSGRRADVWEKPGVSVLDRYCYLYSEAELESWVPRIIEAARHARETHVIMNNCYSNYGTTNARELTAMLERVYGSG
jgi:uncharacterized protein YecE (DUF72 family)